MEVWCLRLNTDLHGKEWKMTAFYTLKRKALPCGGGQDPETDAGFMKTSSLSETFSFSMVELSSRNSKDTLLSFDAVPALFSLDRTCSAQ